MVFRFTALALLTVAIGVACTTFGSDPPPPVDDASASLPDGPVSTVPVDATVDARVPDGMVPSDAGTDSARPGKGLIFVSTGGLTGAMGVNQQIADARCNDEAKGSGLRGTFVALLRLAPNDALTVRLLGSKGPRYVPGTPDGGAPAMPSVEAFMIGTFGPVPRHADASPVTGGFVWTGGFEPTEAGACVDAGPWTSDNAFFYGYIGDPRQSGPAAGNCGASTCAQTQGLYCVEVGVFQ